MRPAAGRRKTSGRPSGSDGVGGRWVTCGGTERDIYWSVHRPHPTSASVAGTEQTRRRAVLAASSRGLWRSAPRVRGDVTFHHPERAGLSDVFPGTPGSALRYQ